MDWQETLRCCTSLEGPWRHIPPTPTDTGRVTLPHAVEAIASAQGQTRDIAQASSIGFVHGEVGVIVRAVVEVWIAGAFGTGGGHGSGTRIVNICDLFKDVLVFFFFLLLFLLLFIRFELRVWLVVLGRCIDCNRTVGGAIVVRSHGQVASFADVIDSRRDIGARPRPSLARTLYHRCTDQRSFGTGTTDAGRGELYEVVRTRIELRVAAARRTIFGKRCRTAIPFLIGEPFQSLLTLTFFPEVRTVGRRSNTNQKRDRKKLTKIA